jgi:hypothetical protein
MMALIHPSITGVVSSGSGSGESIPLWYKALAYGDGFMVEAELKEPEVTDGGC